MKFNYAKSADTAHRMLQKFGLPITIRRVTTGAYDPTIGAAPVTSLDSDGIGALFSFHQRDVDGSRIKVGDQQLLLSPKKVDGTPMPRPSTDDLVVIGQDHYTIQPSKELAPAGGPVLYDLHIRGVGGNNI